MGALAGGEGDATPFTKVTLQDVSDRLHSLGFQRAGNEVLRQQMAGGHTENEVRVGKLRETIKLTIIA